MSIEPEASIINKTAGKIMVYSYYESKFWGADVIVGKKKFGAVFGLTNLFTIKYQNFGA